VVYHNFTNVNNRVSLLAISTSTCATQGRP